MWDDMIGMYEWCMGYLVVVVRLIGKKRMGYSDDRVGR